MDQLMTLATTVLSTTACGYDAVSRHDNRRPQRARKPITASVTGRLPSLHGTCSITTPCSGHRTRRAA